MTEDVRNSVIWSFEHRRWWRSHKWGYTQYLYEAGRYTRAEADTIVADANRYLPTGTIHEVAMSVAEAQALTGQEPGSIIVFLKDGRTINITHDADPIASLRAQGITLDQIDRTVHHLPTGVFASITCPWCGMASYNRHDIDERYCGWCHQFHEDQLL